MIQYGSSQQCSTFRNDNALFLFPWEPHNAYHTLNDNIMALLASSLLQFALSPPTLRKELSPRVLYRFKAFAPRPVSTLFQTIGLLYPNSASAYKLLTGGPHCITRATWGTQMKPFYRDSLHLLRYRLYDLLKHTLSHALQLPIIPAARNLTVSSSFDLSRVPKVIIVTRNMNESSNAGTQTRKLSVASERLLVQEFEKLGTHVSICCDFGRMDAKALVETFWDVDICVGIHGAGLGNCVLGARGLVLAELQVAYNFGFDSFMKIAHMTRGSYVFHDIRNAPNNRGVVLSPEVVRDLAHVALAAWRRSQGDLPVVDQRSARDSMLETVLKAATAPMPQPSSPEAVTERLYNHEVVVDGTNRRLFARDLQFAQSLRIDKERWDVRERRGASRPASTPPSSRREFWIFPNPFVHSDRVESILGPRFTENYGHCVTLPYLKFRVMTQAPGARSLECDRHIIHTKRSGMNDNAITTSLLPR